MRRVAAEAIEQLDLLIHRVIEVDRLHQEYSPDLRFLVVIRTPEDEQVFGRLSGAGLHNVFGIKSQELLAGDVVVPHKNGKHAWVLYREANQHHSLLLTNRCNSYCLMCSQPPTEADDSWRVDEIIQILHHIRISPPIMGLSGGEPLLLDSHLGLIFQKAQELHPTMLLEVLTNGRLLAKENLAETLLAGLGSGVTWLVPLYGHASFIHDFVVQAPGAFEETIAGLLALQKYQQAIQLRVVLIEPTLQNLPEICEFIGKNLPFVREVALMGCEPIGFALANESVCNVAIDDWSETLVCSINILKRYRLKPVLMNIPLCALPNQLWPYMHKSISDWKNVYIDECESCSVKDSCTRLFAWHERGWTPAKIKAIKEI